MLLAPPVLALVTVSLVVSVLMVMAAGFALRVLRHWDLGSGSERQLRLERRTYLIATLVAFSFAAEVVSLLLFVYNAEALHTQFVGAMCATGVLNASAWGWPTLFLKIAAFFAGAAWLTLNRLDNRGWDYPLIRLKYGALLAVAPLVVAGAAVQLRYFLDLNPDVITSCCGSLFSADAAGVAGEVAGIAPRDAAVALIGSGLLVLATGAWLYRRGTGGAFFAGAATLAFAAALVALVSLIALYVYEHPHHHCPFCLLKAGHDHVGYWLYLPLFAGTAFALGAAVVAPWHRVPSLAQVAPGETRRLTLLALAGFAAFYAVAAWAVARSSLTMTGVWW
jgi:hypothetical protein